MRIGSKRLHFAEERKEGRIMTGKVLFIIATISRVFSFLLSSSTSVQEWMHKKLTPGYCCFLTD